MRLKIQSLITIGTPIAIPFADPNFSRSTFLFNYSSIKQIDEKKKHINSMT